MNKYIAFIALLGISLYGGFKLFPLLAGPSVLITSPIDGSSFPSHTVLIAGVAEHTETLHLNGAVLPIDEKGGFSKTLTLPSGGAILSLTATDRFGKQETLSRSVYIPE